MKEEITKSELLSLGTFLMCNGDNPNDVISKDIDNVSNMADRISKELTGESWLTFYLNCQHGEVV